MNILSITATSLSFTLESQNIEITCVGFFAARDGRLFNFLIEFKFLDFKFKFKKSSIPLIFSFALCTFFSTISKYFPSLGFCVSKFHINIKVISLTLHWHFPLFQSHFRFVWCFYIGCHVSSECLVQANRLNACHPVIAVRRLNKWVKLNCGSGKLTEFIFWHSSWCSSLSHLKFNCS